MAVNSVIALCIVSIHQIKHETTSFPWLGILHQRFHYIALYIALNLRNLLSVALNSKYFAVLDNDSGFCMLLFDLKNPDIFYSLFLS